MHKKITLIIGLLLLLSVPHITNAQYVSASSFFNNFANSRTATAKVQAQQELSEKKRAAEQAAYFASQENTSTLHAAASESSSSQTSSQAPSQATTPSSITVDGTSIEISSDTLRALARIQENQNQARLREQALSLLANDPTFTLHSGAQLDGPTDYTVTGKGDVTGKGGTGKGGPEFLPTKTTALYHTGPETTMAFIVVLIAISTTFALAKKDKVVA